MVEFATWEKFIRLSSGSEAMKELIINHVVERFGEPKCLDKAFAKPELLDSFLLGYSYGELLEKFTYEEENDFYETIKLTRDTDNVPIVSGTIGSKYHD